MIDYLILRLETYPQDGGTGPGRGVYLYRAIDRDGNLVDVSLSER